MDPRDYEKKLKRRERNKEAAARCRQRRLDLMGALAQVLHLPYLTSSYLTLSRLTLPDLPYLVLPYLGLAYLPAPLFSKWKS